MHNGTGHEELVDGSTARWRGGRSGRDGRPEWDVLPVGVLQVDDRGTVVRANPAAVRLLGRPDRAVVGAALTSLVDPVDARAVQDCLIEVGDTGVPGAVVLPLGAGGHDVRLRVVAAGGDGPIVTVEDLGGLAASDRVVEAMRPVLDRWPGLVGIADDRANVVYLNDRGREMIGLAGSDLRGLRTTDLFGPEVFNRYYDEIRPVLLDGCTWTGVVPLLRRSGSTADVKAVLTAAVGPTGGTIEWLLAVTGTEDESVAPGDLAWTGRTTTTSRAWPTGRCYLDCLRLALLRRDRGELPGHRRLRRPRRLQGGERRRGSPGRRRPAASGGRAARRLPPACRHRGPLGWRRVRGAVRGHFRRGARPGPAGGRCRFGAVPGR